VMSALFQIEGVLAVNSSNVVYNQPVMFPAMYHESFCMMMGTQILANYANYAN